MSITEKFVAGTFLNADGDPEVGGTVTATISNRIVRSGADNLVIEDDETVTAVTDGVGRFAIALHPNNQPGDSPLNTHWTVTEPSGHTEFIFIPYNHSLGGSDSTAIPYTSLIVDPTDLDPPTGGQTLSDRLTRVEAIITAMNTMNQAGLSGLSPPVSTALVDAAESVGSLATSSTNGLLASSDFQIISTLRSGQTNDVANMVKKDSMGIIIPSVTDPANTGFAGRLFQSATDGSLNVQLGTPTAPAGGRTRLSPSLRTPSWLVTADITISLVTMNNLATFDVLANATYKVTGDIFYSADAANDLVLGFAGVPSGSTLRWGKIAIAGADVGTDGVSEADFNIATGNQELKLGGNGPLRPLIASVEGVLKTGANAGTITLQGRKDVAGAQTCAIFAASALFFVRYA